MKLRAVGGAGDGELIDVPPHGASNYRFGMEKLDISTTNSGVRLLPAYVITEYRQESTSGGPVMACVNEWGGLSYRSVMEKMDELRSAWED